jgi:3-deoxy-7-phosphoheptulonate synthase
MPPCSGPPFRSSPPTCASSCASTFEKPRTTIGWKGLINDPYLDQSYKINDGLRLARRLLLDLAEMGVPTGTEFLDMISPQYIAGLVSWGAIGARTTESQVHRQLVSGVSCPVGFKNATSGDVQVAIDAVQSAAHSHTFLGHTKHGQSAIFVTTGNPDCHIILRGGRGMVNYTAESVADRRADGKAGVPPRIMIDFSHANSNKDYRRQAIVCHDVAGRLPRKPNIIGVMIESNLVAGAQKLVPGQPLVYGQSITDACIDWALKRTRCCDRPATGTVPDSVMSGPPAILPSRRTVITGPQKRGTGGTLILAWKECRDQSHPPLHHAVQAVAFRSPER